MFDHECLPFNIPSSSPTWFITVVGSRSHILTGSWKLPLDYARHVVIFSSGIIRRSFGMVCFEVATRREPFPGKTAIHVMNIVGIKGERPQLPAASKPYSDVVVLMEKCWQQDPNDRPDDFDPVVADLEKALRSAGGDPREGSGGSHSEFSNIDKAEDKIGHALNHSPGMQLEARRDKGTPIEASHAQKTAVGTFREASGTPHCLAQWKIIQGFIKRVV